MPAWAGGCRRDPKAASRVPRTRVTGSPGSPPAGACAPQHLPKLGTWFESRTTHRGRGLEALEAGISAHSLSAKLRGPQPLTGSQDSDSTWDPGLLGQASGITVLSPCPRGRPIPELKSGAQCAERHWWREISAAVALGTVPAARCTAFALGIARADPGGAQSPACHGTGTQRAGSLQLPTQRTRFRWASSFRVTPMVCVMGQLSPGDLKPQGWIPPSSGHPSLRSRWGRTAEIQAGQGH